VKTNDFILIIIEIDCRPFLKMSRKCAQQKRFSIDSRTHLLLFLLFPPEIQPLFSFQALKSLQKYPLLLHSGQECKVLKNFGPGLCKIIDEKLERHLSGHGDRPAFTSTCSGSQMIELEAQTVPVAASCSRAATAAPCGPASPTKTTKTTTAGKSSKSKEYVPGRRTAAYAVLLTLHRNLAAGFLTKKDLQEAAQPLSDASLTRSVPNSRYTGWSCVSQLIDKGLIVKSGCPARFQLTESGKVLAQRLDQVEAEFQEPQPTISNG